MLEISFEANGNRMDDTSFPSQKIPWSTSAETRPIQRCRLFKPKRDFHSPRLSVNAIAARMDAEKQSFTQKFPAETAKVRNQRPRAMGKVQKAGPRRPGRGLMGPAFPVSLIIPWIPWTTGMRPTRYTLTSYPYLVFVIYWMTDFNLLPTGASNELKVGNIVLT